MRKRKKHSRGPTQSWSAYLDTIRHRYPYVLPTAVVKERHYNAEGLDPRNFAAPHNTRRKRKRMSKQGSRRVL